MGGYVDAHLCTVYPNTGVLGDMHAFSEFKEFTCTYAALLYYVCVSVHAFPLISDGYGQVYSG